MTQNEITIPIPHLVPTSNLKVDGKNPNKMDRETLDRVKASIKKFGFIVPIITNKDLVIADGEHRWIAANELAMHEVLIVDIPVAEVDRYLIRQVLNSSAVRGVHDRELDAVEFQTIIDLGREKDLKYLLNLSDDKLDSYLKEEQSINYERKFQLIANLPSEEELTDLYNRLTN